MFSVFISSTSFDLRAHRAAVDKAIRRLEMRPINMDDFGSQPGGATGVSLREVGKADVFVGIIAHRYGYVPEYPGKSVTEQEYDEAVKQGIPRLMYLVDPEHDWLEENYERNNPDAPYNAEDELKRFKQKIETNDVRSLFTTPDNLSEQVSIDLVKWQDKQRKQQRLFRVIAAILIVVALVSGVLIADAGIRSDLIEIAGLASETPTLTATYTPTPTPTNTSTPTPTSTPTNTPTVTPTPLEGAVFGEGEVGIILANFVGSDYAEETVRRIERQLEEADANFIRVNHAIEDRDHARAVSEIYNATLVIWGERFESGVEVFYEVTSRRTEVVTTIDNIAVSADLKSFNTYIFEGMDVLYVINFVQGQIDYFEEDYDSALQYFNNAIERIPEGREADIEAAALYFYQGTTYYYLENPAESIINYTQAIALDPQYVLAHYNRGYVYRKLGELEQAIDDYTQAITLDPQYADAYNNRGNIYNDLGEYERAIDDYTQVITLDPQDAVAYNGRANAYNDLGEHEQAIIDYNQAIELDSQFADAFFNRGVAYLWLGEYEQAIDDYTQAITLAPQDAVAYYNRGVAYSDLGEIEQAIIDYNQAIELDSQYADAYNNRGVVYYGLGDYEQAIADFSQAIVLDPQYPDTYYNRGNSYTILGQYEQALADYNQAIVLNPQDAVAYRNRGLVYYILGNYDMALADYHQYEQLTGTLEPLMLEHIAEMKAALEGD